MKPYNRIWAIYLQNDIIGDGIFVYEVAKILREYADMLEHNQAGQTYVEVYNGPRGTKVTATGVTCYGKQIPERSPIEDLHLPDQKETL